MPDADVEFQEMLAEIENNDFSCMLTQMKAGEMAAPVPRIDSPRVQVRKTFLEVMSLQQTHSELVRKNVTFPLCTTGKSACDGTAAPSDDETTATDSGYSSDGTLSWADVCLGDTLDATSLSKATQPEDISETRTTVMMRNLPCDLNRDILTHVIDSEGFYCRYDFVYMPMDFNTGCARGFAFVNLISSDDALRFMGQFQGFGKWPTPSRKTAKMAWSDCQGLQANIARQSGSTALHDGMHDLCKPALYTNGVRAHFSLPARKCTSTGKSKAIQASQSGNSSAARAPLRDSELTVARVRDARATAVAQSAVGAEQAEFTTVIFRNLPNDYTRDIFVQQLDSEGFAGKYDFVYVPIDFARGSALGYAFVNLVDHKSATVFREHFHGFTVWKVPSRKVAIVQWSKAQSQGLALHIERYRNNSMMHDGTPDVYKPAIFKHGCRIPFPGPSHA